MSGSNKKRVFWKIHYLNCKSQKLKIYSHILFLIRMLLNNIQTITTSIIMKPLALLLNRSRFQATSCSKNYEKNGSTEKGVFMDIIAKFQYHLICEPPQQMPLQRPENLMVTCVGEGLCALPQTNCRGNF